MVARPRSACLSGRAGATVSGASRLRTATKLAVHHLGILALLRRARRRARALVVRYHAVAADGLPAPTYAGPEITIPRSLFAAQMRFLRRAYTPVPLAAMVDALSRGQAPPSGSVAVTFDDGYADNYFQAFPVLREQQIPATVYVATEGVDGGPVLWTSELRAALMTTRAQRLRVEIGGGHDFDLGDDDRRRRAVRALTHLLVPVEAALRRRILSTIRGELEADGTNDFHRVMLTSAQIRELHRSGITIGAHTQTHSNMTLVSPEQARIEIGGSRERLEAMIGAPVCDFAYPNTGGRYPHFNDAVAGVVRELGFRSAATSVPGAVTAASDRYKLPRVGVSPRLYREAPLAIALERYRLLGEVSA